MPQDAVILLLALNMSAVGGLLLLIGTRMRESSGLRRIALGAITFGLAHLLRLGMGMANMHPAGVVADAGMALALLWLVTGLGHFAGKPPVPQAHIALAVLAYAALALAAALLWPDKGRIAVLQLLLMSGYVVMGSQALLALRCNVSGLRPALLLIALLMTGLTLGSLARLVTVLLHGAAVLYSGRWALGYYVYATVAAVLLGPCLLWLVFLRLNDQLRELATRDPLTGLLNRNGLEHALRRHFGRRPLRPLMLLHIDVDHFKRINDEHGHMTGDQALRGVATMLRAQLCGTDFIARLGGEEFLVGAEAGDIARVHALAERLREAVATDVQPLTAGRSLRCTVSVGVSQPCIDLPGWQAALRDADLALYAAKLAGRNRVVLAHSDDGPAPPRLRVA